MCGRFMRMEGSKEKRDDVFERTRELNNELGLLRNCADLDMCDN